jgi:hypothetical protein
MGPGTPPRQRQDRTSSFRRSPCLCARFAAAALKVAKCPDILARQLESTIRSEPGAPGEAALIELCPLQRHTYHVRSPREG